MKYLNYVIERPNGDIEEFRCPDLFAPRDVREHLSGCVVFVFIPRGHSALGADDIIYGPTWALIKDRELLRCSSVKPKTCDDVKFWYDQHSPIRRMST